MTDEQYRKANHNLWAQNALENEKRDIERVMNVKPRPYLNDIIEIFRFEDKSRVLEKIRRAALMIIDHRKDEIDREIKELEKKFEEI